jgi:transposase
MFQLYLDEFSKVKPEEFKIIVLDNGAFHKAKSLKIPANTALLFFPPYSPELNPAEKMWQQYKREFANKLFNSLDEITGFITE